MRHDESGLAQDIALKKVDRALEVFVAEPSTAARRDGCKPCPDAPKADGARDGGSIVASPATARLSHVGGPGASRVETSAALALLDDDVLDEENLDELTAETLARFVGPGAA